MTGDAGISESRNPLDTLRDRGLGEVADLLENAIESGEPFLVVTEPDLVSGLTKLVSSVQATVGGAR